MLSTLNNGEIHIAENIAISKLTVDRLDEAIEVFLNAFKNEAFTSFWFDLDKPKLREAYAAAVRIKYLIHLEADEPFYVALDDKRIVGLAVLVTPHAGINKLKLTWLTIKSLPQMAALVSPALRVVHSGLIATKAPAALPKPHLTIEALAVDPGCQGRGIGRLLLDYVHHSHDEKKHYSGFYLVTGDEKNVDIYKRFGYELVEKRNTGGFISYHMFKS